MPPDDLVTFAPQRIGVEKHGDQFSLCVSVAGEPIHQFGPPVTLALQGPFYVGIGFVSHLPETVDGAVLSHVVIEDRADAVH